LVNEQFHKLSKETSQNQRIAVADCRIRLYKSQIRSFISLQWFYANVDGPCKGIFDYLACLDFL